VIQPFTQHELANFLHRLFHTHDMYVVFNLTLLQVSNLESTS